MVHLPQRRNQARNNPRNQSPYNFFVVHLPYYINKAIIIHVFYFPWNKHCITWVMDVCWNTSSGVSKNLLYKSRIKVRCTSAVILLWDITKRKRKRLNYRIEEWHTSTTFDIFWNQSTYPTVCLLLDKWNRNYHCITVCGKWIFDSNLKVALLLTQVCLNYTCRCNDTGENKCVGVFNPIRAVPPEVLKEY